MKEEYAIAMAHLLNNTNLVPLRVKTSFESGGHIILTTTLSLARHHHWAIEESWSDDHFRFFYGASRTWLNTVSEPLALARKC